jgi:murein L,D-transpeptidase YcbB/YkuD
MDLSRSQPVLDLTPDTSKLATQDLDFESAHDHSGVQDRLPQRDVRVNMSDRDVQYMLKELGFYSGSLDGKAGPQTKAAVRSFQKKHGLTVDGKAGPQTKRTLVKKLKEKLARNL